jgi:hypothetical protein
MNINEVLEYLTTSDDKCDCGGSKEYPVHDCFYDDFGYGNATFKTDKGEFLMEVLESVGGGEGGGEKRYVVFRLTHNGESIVYRRNGAYYSYHGTDWYDYDEVKPVEKTITVWEAV